ncbi:hypothetical protein AMK09_37590 [Streptomyces sp. CB02488]|nr:hypothetical protein AMK09_37590 [Streptomyces sp. CB02488]
MSCGELSGVDLARQALLAARKAAKKNGATRQKPKRRTGTAVRRDGREPLGLGSAIGMMMTERGMAAPVAGGSVLARFDAILAAAVPELAGRVRAVAFDADTGRLDVVPDAPAVGTKLRWSAPKLIAAANDTVPGANVRALHVLSPAPVKARPPRTRSRAHLRHRCSAEPWPAMMRPTWRPDIRAAVISKARINMHRKLLNMAKMTGMYPLAVLSDCVVYPAPSASPLDFLPYATPGKPQPGAFRLGPTPGLAKLEGVQDMAWAVDLMEKGLNPARHIKGDGHDAVLDEGE